MNLSDLGEFGLIERLRRAVVDGRDVILGIGDDCAVTRIPPGLQVLTTTDLLVENIHFRRDWTDFKQLGRKSVSVNVSDIAAMGGNPRHLSLGLALPSDLTVEDFDSFLAGFLEAAKDYRATLIGGDLSRSPGPLTIAVTVQGVVEESRYIPRTGARPGDLIFLSGTLGDSALALHLLQKSEVPDPFLARRLHDPKARLDLARTLADQGIPSSMIDISDGLLADLGHILDASGSGAEIFAEKLPLSGPFQRSVDLDSVVIKLAWTGGEDYELLFTIPQDREKLLQTPEFRPFEPLTRIGVIRPPESGLQIIGGFPDKLAEEGFSHF